MVVVDCVVCGLVCGGLLCVIVVVACMVYCCLLSLGCVTCFGWGGWLLVSCSGFRLWLY